MEASRVRDILLGAAVGAAAVTLLFKCLRSDSATKPAGNTRPDAGGALEQRSQFAEITTAHHTLTDEILSEQLTRNLQFFGEEAQQKLAKAFVVVIGLGVRPSHLTCKSKPYFKPKVPKGQFHGPAIFVAGCWQPCCCHVTQVRHWASYG